MKTVLITGAEGNIGSRLRANLAGRYTLRSITRDPVTGLASTVADIADLAAIRPAFDGVDAVVHLAASSAVQSSWPDVLHNNIEGAYAVFEAARLAGVRQVVFASSNHAAGMHEIEHGPALYRSASGVMVSEQEPVRPDSLYGVSKVFGEALGRFYSERYGLSVYCLRIGWVSPYDRPVPVGFEQMDDPPLWAGLTREETERRSIALWLSHADLAGLVVACLRAEQIRFGIYYGVSDNPYRFFSLDRGRADLGWWPQDLPPLIEDEPER